MVSSPRAIIIGIAETSFRLQMPSIYQQIIKTTNLSKSGDDCLWMYFERDEPFCLLEQFASEDDDGGGSIADFVILHFGDVDQDFGRGIVDSDGLQDRGSIVRHLKNWGGGGGVSC